MIQNSTNNGIMMMGGTPIMEGTWYNAQTGDSFTVRDTVMTDGQLVVFTTDGRQFTYDALQNYIQSDKPIQMPPKQTKHDDIPDEVKSLLADDDETGMLPEDMELISGARPVNNTPMGNLKNSIPMVEPQVNQNHLIIDRALKKFSMPELNANALVWNNYPEEAIKTLLTFMDIPIEDISEYYINRFDMNALYEMVRKSISSYINAKSQTVSSQPNKPAEPLIEEKEKPVTKKTKKSKK